VNPFAFLFERRVRGFRVIEIAAFVCLVCLVFGVYFSKAHAGRETGEIGDVDQQIADAGRRVRLLQAEVARLEAPDRVARLSERLLGFQPVPAQHETSASGLMEIARQAGAPQPAKPGAKASAAFMPSPGPIFTVPGAPATPAPAPATASGAPQ
jgi:hypothetical protein